MESPRRSFEQIVLVELGTQWKWWAKKFGWTDRLGPPALKLHEGREKLGTWTSSTREMSFSKHLVYERAWHETIEVLKHEMAHQFCDEILHSDDLPHGKTFQAVCHQHGIDAAPRGIPGATSIDASNHIVEKIRHLLDLASGGANPNECERAAQFAHNLMLKYNIELREKNAEQNYVVRFLGRPSGRIQDFQGEIAHLLNKHYFVEIIWHTAFNPRTGRSGHELEVCGTSENVEVAEYIHDFLMREALAAWERTRDSKKFAEAREEETGSHYGTPETERGYTLAARKSFLAGFISGFRSTLRDARIAEEKAGLVLARDAALEAFFKKRHPSTITFGGTSGSRSPLWGAQGFNAGKSLNVPPAARAARSTPLLGKGR
jgi:Protein of unknown function (DUF2786)/SprT-like family